MNSLGSINSWAFVALSQPFLYTQVVPAAYMVFPSTTGLNANATATLTSSVTVTGQTPTTINGTYTMLCSSEFNSSGDYRGHSCWNGVVPADWFWASNGGYANTNYTGTATTSLVGGGSISGEWNQIKLPASAAFACTRFVLRSESNAKLLQGARFLGSNDGTGWTLLGSIDSATPDFVGGTTITVTFDDNTTAFTYYRIVVTKTAAATPSYPYVKMALFRSNV